MVVRGDTIVVPETLKQRMIEIAHEGHQVRSAKETAAKGTRLVPGNGLSV